MELIIKRRYLDDCTLGTATLQEGDNILFSFKTLELPYKDNQRGISCIPEGEYELRKNTWQLNKFGYHFDVLGCEPRQGVKIHSGNFTSQIRGCILPGSKHLFLNKDQIMDISEKLNLKCK